MTGSAPDVAKVREAKQLATKPVLLGSGTTAENIAEFLRYADGVLVGTSLKYDGVAHNPVDPARVRRFMEVVRGVRESAASAASVNR